MRKNVKKQLALRVLSTAALLAMVSSIATAAFAEEYNVAKGSVEIVAEEGSQYITQRDDTGTFVQDKLGNIDHREDPKIVLVTKDETTGETTPTSNTVTITAENKDDTANVTLKDVFINREGASNSDAEAALTVKGDGKTNIELNGNNTLSSTGAHAGLEKTDAECSGTLTITDDKNDDGSEKEEKDKYGYSTGGDTGTLAVIGGGQGGASIGGQGRMNRWDSSSDPGTEEDHSTSNITITGGTIRAGYTPDGCNYNYHWNTGAGIGGGAEVGGNGTNITITGNADVDAYGSYYAAGIGGAGYGSKEGEDGKWYHAGGNGENITISGNAKVTAQGWDAAGIGGGGFGLGKNIQIKDNADVSAIGGTCCAGIGGGEHYGGEVSISGNATVFAKAGDRGAGIGSGNFNGTNVSPELMDTTVTISDNATVTAIGSSGAAIGNGWDHRNLGKTDIIITGGTVNAVSGSFSPAIGGSNDIDDGHPAQNVTVTINGTTGNTTVNASCIKDVEHAISKGNGTADIIGYNADGVSPFGEDHSVVVRMYKKGSASCEDYDHNTHRYKTINCNSGELYQTVHNRKYMDENLGTSNLKDDDLHDWRLNPDGEYKEPTLEEDGYADCICSIDKCGQTKRVVLPKLTPEESGSVETREVGVIFWDAAAQAAPAALQGKVLSADEKTATAEKAQVESLLADKANWKLAEDVGDLMIHPAADAAGTVYEQAVKASGCQYYVIANVTAQ